MSNYDWFYIKHIASEGVMSSAAQTKAQPQVVVVNPRMTDDELWCWNGSYLMNKSTNLVLDIHKGRIRFSEDTEICLNQMNPSGESDNQQWFSNVDYKPARRLFGKIVRAKVPMGSLIYSATNHDWVLETCPKTRKVILFPVHNDHSRQQQRWEFIPEKEMPLLHQEQEIEEPSLLSETDSTDSSISYYSPTSSISQASSEFTFGLTPARKRGSSQSSISSSSRKESLNDSTLCPYFPYHPKQL
ncbi:hypothetical protein EDC96DRAFT_608792 [Choanephora cucurbitarum]|nr:hypothetical protein EDC96DRAFT_608792 [Choanephora cucurbitarum]